MTLQTQNVQPGIITLPPEVRRFLGEADLRIERFQRDSSVPGFVPSDYRRAYGVLARLAESSLAPGDRLCEWGSGFGVVACLAAMVGFDACGIEIDGDLVREARELADDFDLSVEFIRGSFIPRGGEKLVGDSSSYNWLTTDGEDHDADLGGPADFDVIFAYPWPDEEKTVARLFDAYARNGAILVTHHGGDEFQVRRKTGRRR